MQHRAAPGTAHDRGWRLAFILALGAATLSVVVLVVVINRDPDPVESAAPVVTDDATTPTAATTARPPQNTPTPAPTATPTRRPFTPVAPVQPFGRSVTLIDDPELREAIEDALGDEREDFSVVVVRPWDGRSALVDADREFYAASLFKLAILYEAGLRLSSGELYLDDFLEISEEDLEQDLGTLEYQERDEDGNLTILNALDAMVTVSDNSTAVAFLHLFEGHNVDATLRGLGIETTSVNSRDLPTTARDMARIMDAIVAGEGLDPASHELLLGMLSHQTVRSGIPRGLPDAVDSGNKTGTWEDITHDVAYVEAETGTYIIAVLSETDRDWDAIRDVSEAVYELMASR
jgi:beta-lactamase class A